MKRIEFLINPENYFHLCKEREKIFAIYFIISSWITIYYVGNFLPKKISDMYKNSDKQIELFLHSIKCTFDPIKFRLSKISAI